MSENKDLTPLMKVLGYQFKDMSLLDVALTHTSLTKGHRKKVAKDDYERLEFLGDRVLGIVIAEELYRRYEAAEAGQLSRRFNSQVRKETLAEIGRDINLPKYVRMAPELRSSGGAENPSLLEDCVEAVIAALYLDGGMPAAKRFIKDHWWQRFEKAGAAMKDAKSALQEWAAKRGKGTPDYVLLDEEGPDHERTFTIEVRVEGCSPAQARAKSKRQAEKKAAALMLKEHTNE